MFGRIKLKDFYMVLSISENAMERLISISLNACPYQSSLRMKISKAQVDQAGEELVAKEATLITTVEVPRDTAANQVVTLVMGLRVASKIKVVAAMVVASAEAKVEAAASSNPTRALVAAEVLVVPIQALETGEVVLNKKLLQPKEQAEAAAFLVAIRQRSNSPMTAIKVVILKEVRSNSNPSSNLNPLVAPQIKSSSLTCQETFWRTI